MFRIHRSERADALVDALVEILAEPLGDPFAAEIVAVPTRGIERWLTHRVATRAGTSAGRADGICANVEFPFPGRLVGDALARATDVDRELDPWRPERLVWPVLELIDDHGREDWMTLVGTHIGARPTGDGHDDRRAHRRFATARHIAELFDRYGIHRPEMVRAWLDADDTGVPADARWQPELYRRLARHLDAPCPPERMAMACERIERGEVDLELPDRVSLFGLTRLPGSYLDVLQSIATVADVHLFALHPSSALWERLAADGVVARSLRRADDPTRSVAHNPLLRTWADDSREMQLVLSSAGDHTTTHHPLDTGAGPATLLELVQAGIRGDIAPPGPPSAPDAPDARAVVASHDRSIQVHSCHGRFRQVEVLRDAICHLLADDPTLEPRDLIVLCPDIETYAADLEAVFGAHRGATGDAVAAPAPGTPDLPYRLADRSLRQTNPLLGVLAEILSVVSERITIRQVLTLAGRQPVRLRFGWDDDALDRITGWATDAAVRWGLDAAHRKPWSLDMIDANTWRAGLDRILLGVAMDEGGARMIGNRLPLDDVDSGDVDLAGRLAELIDRLATIVDRCGRHQPLDAWTETIAEVVDLLCSTTRAEAWQRSHVEQLLGEIRAEAAGTGTALSLTEVRSLLDHRLQGAPGRTDFRTGAVTMCTLVPMRAVPHRVVCVLGLDAESFPRVTTGDGDDLLLRDPLVGDRDPRTEDRQLLLDALLSATDHLVITYNGRDERTNEHRPRAVPLSELLDVIDDTARPADGGVDGGSVLAHVVRDHPLQPFDPVDFDASAPWGFDQTHLAGARAVDGPRRDPAPFVSGPLPELSETVISIDDLVRFAQHPVREFLRQRLELSTWRRDLVLPDAIPYELDGLEKWQIGDRLLRRTMAGDPLDDAALAEQTLGFLPPGEVGFAVLKEIWPPVNAICGAAERLGLISGATSVDVDLVCGDVRVVGAVPGVHDDIVGTVSYSSLKPKDRLAGWIHLLALTATRPEISWESVLIGKRRDGADVVRHRAIDDIDDRGTVAAHLLERIVDLRRRGLCEPLPLPCATAAAWAEGTKWGRSAADNARQAWTSTFDRTNEDRDAAHLLVFGGVMSFDALLEAAPADDECGSGWDADQTSRFGRLAHRLWGPILLQETDR